MTGSAIRRFTWTLTAIGLSVATNPAFTQPVQERAPTTSSKPETAASADEAYRKGEEFEAKKNHAESMRWYRMAADRGHVKAEVSVGNLYGFSEGVSQDDAEALRWYRKAADQGNEVAQRNVATIYWQGLGVPADRAEAIRWFRKAAEKGDDEPKQALNQLGAQ
jgi:Sel1 repeat